MFHAIHQGGGEIDLSKEATNQYALQVKEEGYFYLLKRMLETKVVDEILLIIESVRGPGKIQYAPNFTGWVIPNINKFDPHLRKDDIIWCRGGHKSNYSFLERAKKKGNWIMLYAANTGRQKWLLWDVILTDFGPTSIDRRGRFWFHWNKPINPHIFKFTNEKRIYDLCIGASYIHDKKGQWKAIDALIEYKKMFGKNPRCILPGAARRGVHSNYNMYKIESYGLDIKAAGMLPRPELAKVLNQSKIFVHAGSSGENDRGPLEAMRCGCFLMIANPQYHSPIVYNDSEVCYVVDSTDPKEFAKKIHSYIQWINSTTEENIGRGVSSYYERVAGMETIILPEMSKLVQMMKENKPGNPEVFRELCSK